MKIFSTLILTCLILPAFLTLNWGSTALSASEDQTTEIRKAYTPREAHELWVEYGRAKNLDALLSLYEPDGAIWDIGTAKSLTTPGERRIFLQEFLDTVADFHLETASVMLNGAGDIALLRSKWYATGVSENDTGTRSEWTSRNCGSEIVRKQADGSWLYILDNPYAATSWDACPSY